MVVCMRWSRYRGRAAVQTSTTDLMDEVSHTHLQFEHLHQTHMGPHNGPHSYNNVFPPLWVTPFGSSTVSSPKARWHLFAICTPIISLASEWAVGVKHLLFKNALHLLPKQLHQQKAHAEMIKRAAFSPSNGVAFSFNLRHFIGPSLRVFRCPRRFFSFPKSSDHQMERCGSPSRQNARMLGWTSAISDFSKLKTPLRAERLTSGEQRTLVWALVMQHTENQGRTLVIFNGCGFKPFFVSSKQYQYILLVMFLYLFMPTTVFTLLCLKSHSLSLC